MGAAYVGAAYVGAAYDIIIAKWLQCWKRARSIWSINALAKVAWAWCTSERW